MPHYYIDFKIPPPFGRSMPGAVGYYSKAGLPILYGKKERDLVLEAMIARAMATKGDLVQQRIAEILANTIPSRGWPDGDDRNRTHKARPSKMPIEKPVEMGPKQRFFRPIGICEICYELRVMTQHHLAPKQLVNMGIGEDRGLVPICRPCHDLVHIHFSNFALLNTHWPDVVEKVREEIEVAPILADQKRLRAKLASQQAAVPDYVKKQMATIQRHQERSALGIRPKRIR